ESMYAVLASRLNTASSSPLFALAGLASVWHRIATFVLLPRLHEVDRLRIPIAPGRRTESSGAHWIGADADEAVSAVREWCEVARERACREISCPPSWLSPLQELWFWRRRAARLRFLLDQLELPSSRRALELTAELRGPGCQDSELERSTLRLIALHGEASDCADNLGELEETLEAMNLGPAEVVAQTLPSMLQNLGRIWYSSRFFNTETLMLPFLERVARNAVEVVTRDVTVAAFGSDRFLDSAAGGQNALDVWEEGYFAVRSQVEDKGMIESWDFDRVRLFGRTRFVGMVLKDLVQLSRASAQGAEGVFEEARQRLLDSLSGVLGGGAEDGSLANWEFEWLQFVDRVQLDTLSQM
ncbi:unnamed protein product, partial [Polarella glacialis]